MKTLTTSLLAVALATPAFAQIPGDNYLITPGLGSAAAGFAFSMAGATDSIIDNAGEQVGTALVAPNDPVISTDTLVDNGGGNFDLSISITSAGDLCPAGFTVGGVAADTAGMFLGASAGASPINFINAAIVNTATISILDAAGAVIGGPFDISGFANFANPDFGGGWDGSVGVTFGAGSAGGIFGFQLDVNYTEGGLLGSFTTTGLGCPAGAELALSIDENPSIGDTVTISCANIPAGALGSMLIGLGSQNLPLDLLGGTGCVLLVDNIIATAPLTIMGTDGTFTLPLANDPANVGGVLNFQAGAISIGINPLGVVLSDLGTMLVGE